ncbi:MAG: hypothetical protein DRQ61_11400 [Gammaproteobacteria bacterium]|nr:MAG: hypothetical protein DRQ61_11400 [Gammaproteobacteria bacterium]
MQNIGIEWLSRLCSEPGRLCVRSRPILSLFIKQM